MVTNPPPSIYSQPNEYTANPYNENANWVPTDDYYLAVRQPSVNSVQTLPPAGVPTAITIARPPVLDDLTAVFGIPNEACPPGWYNDNGTCVPPTGLTANVISGCQSNGDCPSGMICDNGTCVSTTQANLVSADTPISWTTLGLISVVVVIAVIMFMVFRNGK